MCVCEYLRFLTCPHDAIVNSDHTGMVIGQHIVLLVPLLYACGSIKADIKCVESARAGYYYRQHLPILGKLVVDRAIAG